MLSIQYDPTIPPGLRPTSLCTREALARRRFSAARDDAAKSLSRAAAPSRWYTEPYWLLLLTNVKRSRAPTSDLKSRWRNGSTVAASAILSDCTTSLYTLAWGAGGRLKAPPVPFGYFRAVESNRKTRAYGGRQVKLKGQNKKHNPSGSSTHLPLHKGGFGWEVSELPTSVRSASQQTAAAVGGRGTA